MSLSQIRIWLVVILVRPNDLLFWPWLCKTFGRHVLNRKTIGTVARVRFERVFIVLLDIVGSGINFDKNLYIWFKNKMFNFY